MPKREVFHSCHITSGWIVEHDGNVISRHATQHASQVAAIKACRSVRDRGGFAGAVFYRADGSILRSMVDKSIADDNEFKDQWAAPFADPPTLDDGQQILTLSDARDFILTLSVVRQSQRHWKMAMEALSLTAERPAMSTLLAEIAMKTALAEMRFRQKADRHRRRKPS